MNTSISMSEWEVQYCAKVAYEVNRAYCESIGDNTQPAWEDAPAWQKQSAVEGVKFHLARPDASPSASHMNWLIHKEREGWVWGPDKDPDKKTHPCMVLFEELPPAQRTKDYLFRAVVHAVLLIRKDQKA